MEGVGWGIPELDARSAPQTARIVDALCALHSFASIDEPAAQLHNVAA
jgi:hypothetical protein